MTPEPASPKMSFVLTTGSADRLIPFATLVSGAVAMGYEVHIFASFWGLDAFRKDHTAPHPPVSPGHGEDGERLAQALRDRRVPSWKQMLSVAKQIGSVRVYACSQSMDLFTLKPEALDPLVDEVTGVATFVDRTRGAEVTYFV